MRRVVLPLLGLSLVLAVWTALSQTVATDLPSPARTWQESRRYVLEPFFKDGEMNQGIGRLAFYSLPFPNQETRKGRWGFLKIDVVPAYEPGRRTLR